jgi:hypothetical protein
MRDELHALNEERLHVAADPEYRTDRVGLSERRSVNMGSLRQAGVPRYNFNGMDIEVTN